MNKYSTYIFCCIIAICSYNCEDDISDSPIEPDIITQSGLAPCSNGIAGGIYPCQNIDLISRISLVELDAFNADSSWGWTDPTTEKEYALIGLTNGTAFIDISTPENPIYLGKLPTAITISTSRDIQVYKDYAFIVSDSPNHGMQVFDLTKLRDVDVTNTPLVFTSDNRYTGFGNADNIVINEETGFAYCSGTDTYEGGPHFVDISNPKNPVAAGGFFVDNSGTNFIDSQAVTYKGSDTEHFGQEILMTSNREEILIVNVTNKFNPVVLSSISYPDVGSIDQGWLTEDHRYFLIVDGFDESNTGLTTRTIVLDLEDLDNPKFHMNHFGVTNATDRNGYVKGNKYYLANYNAGIRVVDISNIENKSMAEISFFDTYNFNDGSGFNGAWNVYPYFKSGNIVVSDFSSGFMLIKENQ